jgi:putative hemolysin
MQLLSSKELAKATNLNIPGGNIIASLLMKVLRFNKLNELYTHVYSSNPLDLVNATLEHLNVSPEIAPREIENIPEKGACIIVANHPYGGIDALLLLQAVFSRRSDFKAMANFLIQRIEPFRDIMLPVNPFETKKNVRSSLSGIKEGIEFLESGHCIIIFPAGEVSSYQSGINAIMDREWQLSAIKFIKKAEVPVIPVFFYGNNSIWFHLLGTIHPMLRTAQLPSELLNKKNRTIRIRIGKPLSVPEQLAFSDVERFGRYLRARTYSLGTDADVKHDLPAVRKKRLKNPEALIDPVEPKLLEKDFDSLRPSRELFTLNNYSVFFAPSSELGSIIAEIGRLREKTFRSAGEGTNRKTDIDDFDLYFHQLIVWDNETKKIVGAYRIGKGIDIMNIYGLNGFYISTLFRISPSFGPILCQSLELGRSFIVEEYQRKPLSLLLLWKGLITVLYSLPEYRYLIGPVSISNEFSPFAKSLLVDFLRKNYSDSRLKRSIKPRTKFRSAKNIKNLTRYAVDSSEGDIRKIEKIISSTGHDSRIPVLLKKYLELNARVLEFNIDPDFNDCLDALMLLDVTLVPDAFVKTLLKGLNK